MSENRKDVLLRIDPNLVDSLDSLASGLEITRNTLIEHVLKLFVNNEKSQKALVHRIAMKARMQKELFEPADNPPRDAEKESK